MLAPKQIEVRSVSEFMPLLDKITKSSNGDEEFRRQLAQVCLRVPEVDRFAKMDPFSTDYRDSMLDFYGQLFGRPYTPATEGLNINVEHELRYGFPYCTKSAHLVGSFLMAYGHLIRVMGLPPGSKVLELGCGMGSLTWHMSKMGYDVTAVDINVSNATLIGRMTEIFPTPPRVVQGDIVSFVPEDKYDAILFFESYHHFVDHRGLLERCKSWLNPGGQIVLGAEPIVSNHVDAVPYPWGLRLDGESLRAMAVFGWIELGLQIDYMTQVFDRLGLKMQRHTLADNTWGDVIVLRPG